jgi:hypothetical protein
MVNKRTSGKTRSINEQKKAETQSKIISEISEKRGEQFLSRRGIDSSNVVKKNDARSQYEEYITSTFSNLPQKQFEKKIKSNSGFKKWKLNQTAPVIATSGDMSMSLLGKISRENETGATIFKSEPLAQGPLGVEGSANLGQGRAGHTNVHTAIANVPGHVIARQRQLCDNGTTDVIVETWATARTQMNPAAVSAQGRGTIGNYFTIDMRPDGPDGPGIRQNYVTFISRYPQFFGCHVPPLNIPPPSKFKPIGDSDGGFVYNYDTTNIFESIGAGTLFGIPNTKLEYISMREIISMTDWLTNMPLVKQSPMTQGRPQGNKEPPHTEHVLSILDALWYLDLFETAYVPLMKDYHAFMEAWYNANLWGQPPTSGNFLEYLTTIRHRHIGFNGDVEAFLQAIWPRANIMNIEGAWTKIHDFILEYLYANADSNYEKNDDSLICIEIDHMGYSQIVFNEQMAKDLAQRIWKNRLVLRGGLIDIIFGRDSISFKTKDMEKIWKRNIVASWRQRLVPTCAYINNKIRRGGQNLFGLATISNYRYRLPQTIKEIIFGYTPPADPQGEPILTLSQQGTYLVPTDAMTIIVMESISQLMTNFIRNTSGGFKIDYNQFIRFCDLPIDSAAEIFSKIPELKIRRSIRKGDNAEMKYQTIAYQALDTYINSNPVYINFLRNAFIILFYLYEIQVPVEWGVYLVSDKSTLTPEELAVLEQNEEKLKTIYIEKEERRNIIISCLLSQFHILLCGFFLERAGAFANNSNDPLYSFSMDMGQKLNGLIESKRESSIISINNVQIKNEDGSFVSQTVDFDFDTVLQYLSNSLYPTTPDANTVRLFYPFYHYDYATCETFFGKDFDKILVTMADQMTDLNYGTNLVPPTVVEQTMSSLSSNSGPDLKRTYSTGTPIVIKGLEELRRYGNLGAFSPGAGGGAGGGAGSTTDGNDNLTTRQLFEKAISLPYFSGGSKTKKRKSRVILSKRKKHTIRKNKPKPSHKRTTKKYRSK